MDARHICLDYFACLNPFVTDIENLDPAFAGALSDCVPSLSSIPRTGKTLSPRTRDAALSAFRKLLSEQLQRTPCKDGECLLLFGRICLYDICI
jgi:hypothetical protein